MWEINESNTIFFDATKSMSLENLEIWEPKVSKCRKLSIQALLNFLVLGDALRVSAANCKVEEKISSSSPKQIMHSKSTFKGAH